MSKKIIQDIIVKKAGTIEKKVVSLKFPSQKKKDEEVVRKSRKVNSNNFELDINRKISVSKNASSFLWFIALICVVTLVIIASHAFARATITTSPSSFDIEVDKKIKIGKDNNIGYEILEIEKSVFEKTVPDSSEYVEKKAVGTVVLYNEFSTVSQRFITNTRLEATDGLIYKIKQSVDIPGYKMKDGQKIPGSISVEVVAEAAGDKYNMAIKDLKGDFKIAAYKGTTKYDKFYARLSSDIVGGFIGEIKKVSDEKYALIQAGLRERLKNELLSDMRSKIIPDYIVPEGAYKISYSNSNNNLNENDEIQETGKIVAISFNTFDLAKSFSNDTPDDTENTRYYFKSNPDFKVLIDGVINKNSNEISVSFLGKGKNICSFNEEGLTEKIAGSRKNMLASIISLEYANCIDSIQVAIYPQWNIKLPDDPVKIRVIVPEL